jgi:integrase
MSETLRPATVEANYRVLAQLLDDAVQEQLIASSPARGVPLPRQERAVIVPLEHEEIEELAQAIRPDLAAAV